MKKIILLFLTLFVVSEKSFAQDQLNAALQAIAEKYKAVGVAYAVVKDDKIIYDGAIGYQNVADKIVLDPQESLFRIASISKSFTATAIMQLVDQKILNLDDDFGDLLGIPIRNPKYPNTVITLGMVLSHTSSINDSNGYFELDVINPEVNKDWAKSYSDNEPGSTYDYCNLNYNMAGAVLEKLSSIRFDRYIDKQILQPLQLDAGYCVDSLDSKRFAQLYAYNSDLDVFEVQPSAYNPRSLEIKNYKIGYSTPVFSPTGGMKITAIDLAKYMQMHMNYGKYSSGRIISKKSSKLMQTKVSEKEGYGLALRQVNNLIENEDLVGHTGSAYGLYSSMFFSPKKKFGIVVITNGCKPIYKDGHVAMLKEITNVLYDSLLKK